MKKLSKSNTYSKRYLEGFDFLIKKYVKEKIKEM